MTYIVIGNILTLCAMLSDSFSGTRKKHSEIMGVQILSQFFYGASSTILKAYSATAQNIVAVLRNLAAMKNVKSKAIEWILILLGVVLGVILNNRGLLGWIPIVANFEYSVAVFKFKNNERYLKIAFIINSVLFAIFNLIVMNYVGFVGGLVVGITTLISLIKTAGENSEANKEL